MKEGLTADLVGAAKNDARLAFDVLMDAPGVRAFLALDKNVDSELALQRPALVARFADAPDLFGVVVGESDWRLSPAAYAHPSEIAYQARLLEIAPSIYRAARAQSGKAGVDGGEGALVLAEPDRLVALATISPRLPQASPRTFEATSLIMVLAPLGWALVAEIWSAALTHRCGAAHGPTERAWSVLLSTDEADGAHGDAAARPYWAGLAAHVIAAAAAGDSASALGAADATASTAGPLSGALIGCEGWREDGVRSALARAAVDFSLAHELAHIARNEHVSTTGPADETRADYLALQGYFSSWGWRDEFFEGAPLGDVARLPLGVWMFAEMARALVAVRRLVGRHGLIAPETVSQLVVAEREILSRIKALDRAVSDFLNLAVRNGAWPERDADLPRLKAFRARALAHERAAHAWWNGLSPEAVRLAADVAREATPAGRAALAPSAASDPILFSARARA